MGGNRNSLVVAGVARLRAVRTGLGLFASPATVRTTMTTIRGALAAALPYNTASSTAQLRHAPKDRRGVMPGRERRGVHQIRTDVLSVLGGADGQQ